MVTAYDYTAARIADAAGIPIILVGDSLGMVVLGYDSTLPVTMDDMVRHGRMVSRGASQALVVVDLPFMSYQVDAAEALRNAGRLMQEGGAHTVKMEGGVSIAATVRRVVDAGVPVMGHIGLTPQSVNALGGYRVQGRTKAAARRVLDDALAVQEAGAYSVVLECVPAPLAKAITERLTIPTIGIGAGPHCDGQGAGVSRHAGPVPRFRAQARQAICQVGFRYDSGLRAVCRGRKERRVSVGSRELHDERKPSGRPAGCLIEGIQLSATGTSEPTLSMS